MARKLGRFLEDTFSKIVTEPLRLTSYMSRPGTQFLISKNNLPEIDQVFGETLNPKP